MKRSNFFNMMGLEKNIVQCYNGRTNHREDGGAEGSTWNAGKRRRWITVDT